MKPQDKKELARNYLGVILFSSFLLLFGLEKGSFYFMKIMIVCLIIGVFNFSIKIWRMKK